MTKDEALKKAIEAMENSREAWHQIGIYDGMYDGLVNSIITCKEALEQPAQEPVAYNFEGVLFFANEASHYMKDSGQPLYTHPHQVVPTSTWQGLTDDEIRKVYFELYDSGLPTMCFAHAIEQALRSKNAL